MPSAQVDEIDDMWRSLAAAHDAGKDAIVTKIEALRAALSDRAEPGILREISATEQRTEAALAMAALCLPQD